MGKITSPDCTLGSQPEIATQSAMLKEKRSGMESSNITFLLERRNWPLIQATPCYPEVLGILNSRIIPVKIGPSVDVVFLSKVVSKVVLVSFSSDNMYVCRLPNKFRDD